MKKTRVAIVVIAMMSAACSAASVPSGSSLVPTPPAPGSTALATSVTSAPAVTPEPSPGVLFRALDTPADYGKSGAEAVDGATAVGWVQIGKVSEPERPAVWDTTTGAIRVLAVPAEFVHPNGDTFVRLVGVSGRTAVGTGILGSKGLRGQQRAMAWNLDTGDLRILDIPAGFTETEARAIDGTTAVGMAWTAHGEKGRPVTWDTASGAVRTLKVPAAYECSKPRAISGETVVGYRCDGDLGHPIVWDPLTGVARDLDLLPATQDGIPRAVDGTTAVGSCCYGEEGTSRPLLWDTGTGSVRQLTLPARFENGTAVGVSGTVVVGDSGTSALVWDLTTGQVDVLLAPAGYDEERAALAVSGRTIVGFACQPPPSTSANPRCVAAAWTLP